jgi:DNA repair exonuclease SbcCD nuclease subunit
MQFLLKEKLKDSFNMQNIEVKRVWMITDTHFGVRSNSREWMGIIEEFFEKQLIPLLEREGRPGDILVHCGDTFDSRQSINLYVMNKAIDIMERLSSIMPVYSIVGNHDIFMKYSNDINSMKIFKHLQNFTVFESPTMLKAGDKKLFFLPWVDNHHELTKIIKDPANSADVMFCHADVSGISFNRYVKTEDGADINAFAGYHRVYSGHIHYAQKYKNVRMLGTPYELTRSDMGNTKAIWRLDLETDEEVCYENTVSPKFLKYRLEWVLERSTEELQALFENNFIDILVTPEWSLNFPFSTFVERFSGYRRINHHIITEEDAAVAEEDESTDGITQEISLITMIENYVNTLPYTDQLKNKLKEVSTRMYYETHKELEEKRSHEN